MSSGIPKRILDHINNQFRKRFSNKATIIFRDKTDEDEYGRPVWMETSMDTQIFMRVYRVRGLEATSIGLKVEGNFIFQMPPITSPRPPREDDLLIVDGRKYKILNVTPYTDQNGTILAYSGLVRIFKTGEV
jgi:hypothetical protein